MKKLILCLFVLIITTGTFAQQYLEVVLWPQTYDDNPVVRVFLPEKPNGKAIIDCPGGGYQNLAMEHEGTQFAPWLNDQGIALIILKYRMPKGNHEIPLSDAKQAIRIVRQHAKEWNIDPDKVGIMGFSAGGHLASTLATHFDAETRPDFQILFYPVITMDNTYTHGGSRKNLLGENPSDELLQLYSNELQVTPETPKAFILFSDDDKAVPSANGVNYYLALQKNGVSAELHIYPTGGHGWGFRDNFIYKSQWTAALEQWLSFIF
jgi:acetyl esterase/lipase